jgi:TRAP-type C4-dicarboxylate transport system permease small subunit
MKFERAARVIFIAACVIALPAIALLVTGDTILRYFFAWPLAWSQDAVGVALFLLFCAGLPYSWYGDFHVRMDMIYLRLPSVVRMAVDIIGIVAALAFGILLAYRSIISVADAYRHNSWLPSGVIPIWPVQAIGAIFLILFCFAMLDSLRIRWQRRGASAK